MEGDNIEGRIGESMQASEGNWNNEMVEEDMLIPEIPNANMFRKRSRSEPKNYADLENEDKMEMAMYEKYSALLASEINNEMPQTNLIVGESVRQEQTGELEKMDFLKRPLTNPEGEVDKSQTQLLTMLSKMGVEEDMLNQIMSESKQLSKEV